MKSGHWQRSVVWHSGLSCPWLLCTCSVTSTTERLDWKMLDLMNLNLKSYMWASGSFIGHHRFENVSATASNSLEWVETNATYNFYHKAKPNDCHPFTQILCFIVFCKLFLNAFK